jgi:hypothetical protein
MTFATSPNKAFSSRPMKFIAMKWRIVILVANQEGCAVSIDYIACIISRSSTLKSFISGHICRAVSESKCWKLSAAKPNRPPLGLGSAHTPMSSNALKICRYSLSTQDMPICRCERQAVKYCWLKYRDDTFCQFAEFFELADCEAKSLSFTILPR